MAGFDISASVSTSSTATSGAQLGNFSNLFGDTTAGADAPSTRWLPYAAAVLIFLAALWLLKKPRK